MTQRVKRAERRKRQAVREELLLQYIANAYAACATKTDEISVKLEDILTSLSLCVWCDGTGTIRETNLLCRTCRGSGRSSEVA